MQNDKTREAMDREALADQFRARFGYDIHNDGDNLHGGVELGAKWAWNAALAYARTPQQAVEPVLAQEISPCPYATFSPEENQGVSFIVKKHDDYFDYVEIENGKPSRCIRVQLKAEQGVK
jgi:hypothetical protein